MEFESSRSDREGDVERCGHVAGFEGVADGSGLPPEASEVERRDQTACDLVVHLSFVPCHHGRPALRLTSVSGATAAFVVDQLVREGRRSLGPLERLGEDDCPSLAARLVGTVDPRRQGRHAHDDVGSLEEGVPRVPRRHDAERTWRV
jgi:hypothetical protein